MLGLRFSGTGAPFVAGYLPQQSFGSPCSGRQPLSAKIGAVGLFRKSSSRTIALFTYDQYTGHMQVVFPISLYAQAMKTEGHGPRLKAFREAAGLSQRELARQIEERQSNVQYWETTGKLPRSDILLAMAKALGISVEELLGEQKPRRAASPRGRLGQVFDEVSQLPRRQQQKIIEMAEGFLVLHGNKNDNVSR
jgi:transcriptional regulator with XRE-family HTH domain